MLDLVFESEAGTPLRYYWPLTRQSVQKSYGSLKLDTLRKRQILAVVDGAGGPPHVLLPRVRAGLPAAAGRLLAAERAADLRPGSRDVHVHDAAVRSFRTDPLQK